MPSRYFRVPLEHVAYVRMIVEAYDGVAAVRSLRRGRAQVEWLVGDGMAAEADELAARLSQEIGLQPIDWPEDWEDL